jgi:hypothetical protein
MLMEMSDEGWKLMAGGEARRGELTTDTRCGFGDCHGRRGAKGKQGKQKGEHAEGYKLDELL